MRLRRREPKTFTDLHDQLGELVLELQDELLELARLTGGTMDGITRGRGETLYVPVPGSHLGIRPGSGIVGTPLEGDRILIDYEGGIYGQAHMGSYDARVFHAWDRHTWGDHGYPTIARLAVLAEELVEVGYLIIDGNGPKGTPQVVVTKQELVDEWCAAEVWV